MSNCVFKDIQDSGLKIQMCEGDTMRNMTSGLVQACRVKGICQSLVNNENSDSVQIAANHQFQIR
ncbi:MAG: hypothetical protein GY809_18220 [Planctomycetes bacterium]|nr:hypothetical protein [Planctomycetota bacterium]